MNLLREFLVNGPRIEAIKGLIVLVLSALAILAVPVHAGKLDIDTVIVFGDSLSDTGNSLLASGGVLPFPSHYNSGRFSNGPVWVDYLAKRLSASPPESDFALPPSFGILASETTCPIAGVSCSYAFGGSGTQDAETPTGVVPGLLTQIGIFASELPPTGADPDALYVIWSGANNYLFPAFNQIFREPIFGPILPPDDPVAVVADIVQAIDILTSLGARNFLVTNLPDLADAPLTVPALASLVDPGVREQLRQRALSHNLELAGAVGQLNWHGNIEDREILLLDAYTLFKLKLSGSDKKTEAGPASGCLLPPLFPNRPCDPSSPPDFSAKLKTRIWDEQHPTTVLHEKLAKRAMKILRKADAGKD